MRNIRELVEGRYLNHIKGYVLKRGIGIKNSMFIFDAKIAHISDTLSGVELKFSPGSNDILNGNNMIFSRLEQAGHSLS
jgi:hypothetical protein